MDAVAPHAGAWIETALYFQANLLTDVAPHAGAWIETCDPLQRAIDPASPLMQGRGLKHALKEAFGDDAVAPHAGAWIETQ